jgi:L-threonylcarbamoyladenylate synthase
MAEIGTDVQRATDIIRSGGLVAIPTETVYGLAADALDPAAVLRIFEAKQRPHFDPLIVHVADLEAAKALSNGMDPLALRLAEAFWPGPLTLVVPKAAHVPDVVTSGLDTLGLRVPAHPLTLDLLRLCGRPLAAPSANPFGYVSPTTAAHVNTQLSDRVDYILDGGPTTVGIESTIVGFEADGPVIYRLGGLEVGAIESVIGPVRLAINQSSDPKAPGQLLSHYAPRIPVHIFDGSVPKGWAESGFGLLTLNAVPIGLHPKETRFLSRDGDMNEAASNLFAALRELGDLPLAGIMAVPLPEIGLGPAMNDRLKRAAGKT